MTSSVVEDVLLTVRAADGMTTNDLVLAICTWPEPVGAILTLIVLGFENPMLSMVWMAVPLILMALSVPDPGAVMTPPVCAKFPFTFKTPLPDDPVLHRFKVPPLTETLPLTVTVAEPVPFAKTISLVAPETDKLPAMVTDGDAAVLKLTWRLCVF